MMSPTIQAFYQELLKNIQNSPNVSKEIRDEIAGAQEVVLHTGPSFFILQYITASGQSRKFEYYAQQDGGFLGMTVYNG